MNGTRFDGISRGIARRLTRRQAVRGLGAAGALGLAGVGAAPGAARAAQDDVCVLAFRATFRLGPSQGDRRDGEFVGELRFGLDRDGALADGTLRLRVAGGVLPVTGQATGASLTLRIATDEDDDAAALVAVGAGERDVARCRGIYAASWPVPDPATSATGPPRPPTRTTSRTSPTSRTSREPTRTGTAPAPKPSCWTARSAARTASASPSTAPASRPATPSARSNAPTPRS